MPASRERGFAVLWPTLSPVSVPRLPIRARAHNRARFLRGVCARPARRSARTLCGSRMVVRIGAWSPRIEADFLEALHRPAPQALEPLGEILRHVAVAHEQRRESSLGHERVVEGKDDELVVDDVEGVAELARVADPGEMANVRLVLYDRGGFRGSRTTNVVPS